MAVKGFLTHVIECIRRETGEPTTNAKYSDDVLIEYIENAWTAVLQDIASRSQRDYTTFFDIAYSEDKTDYPLPPTVGQVVCVEHRSSDASQIYGYVFPVLPASSLDGWTIKSGVLHLNSTAGYNDGDILRVIYKPLGCIRMHEGVAAALTNDADNNECSITLCTTPTKGAVDKRPHAYVGATLRILGADTNDFEQLRLIKSHDVKQNKVVVFPAFDSDLVPSGNVVYEIAPPIPQSLRTPISLKVSRHILALEGNREHLRLIELEYTDALQTLCAIEDNLDGILGKIPSRQRAESPYEGIYRRRQIW